jgi:hypothetical protein
MTTTAILMNMTYRCKFSGIFQTQLGEFGQTNKNVERKTFQHKWKEWVIENKVLIEREYINLTEGEQKYLISFDEFEKKIYNSARFYHRKKSSEKTSESVSRKLYEHHFSKEVLKEMDDHILSKSNECISPAKKFDDYIRSQNKLLDIESYVYKNMKKVYKNRHYRNKCS